MIDSVDSLIKSIDILTLCVEIEKEHFDVFILKCILKYKTLTQTDARSRIWANSTF